MIQKGDLRIAVRTLITAYAPGLASLFVRPDVFSQYLAIMSVIYVALLGAALSRRAHRATYYRREPHA